MTGKPTDNAPWEDPCASIHGIIAAAQEPRRFGAAHEMIVPVSLLSAVVAEMIQTRLQRDSARRRVCRELLVRGVVFHRVGANSICVTDPSDVAKMMDWDCFKEETP